MMRAATPTASPRTEIVEIRATCARLREVARYLSAMKTS
jgi:hypothetical protein